MSLPVAILAGGLATRLGPLAERIPKSLMDVAGKPFAEHQIELLARAGLNEIVFCVGHLGGMIVEALGDGTRWGIRLRYVFDGAKALGTGGAVQRAIPELGRRFFVMYGDSYLECGYAAVERAFLSSGKRGLMTVYRNENQLDVSNVLYADGRIHRYDKEDRTPDMQHIDYGLSVFDRSAFDGWPPDEPFDLSAVFQRLLARGELAAYEVRQRFYEIGSIAGLEETRALLQSRGATVR